MSTPFAPLQGLRVLDFGHYIAGPLAGVFLADQGAEVIHVVAPDRSAWDHHTETALARGKRRLVVDLKDSGQRRQVLDLAATCDVVLENFRPGVMARLGLDAGTLRAVNPALVYVAMPAYSRHDPRASEPAWDGTISAATGLFTDLSIGGAALDLPPTFTPLPLPSVYAGLWGAIGAVAALHRRARTGRGDTVEAPLLDAAMSAAAGVIFQVDDQPARYNVPPLSRHTLDRLSLKHLPRALVKRVHGLVRRQMPPFFRHYRCADGQSIFLCAIDNANHVAKLLRTLDLDGELAELGLVAGEVLDIPPTPNNVNAYRGGSAAWRRLRRRMEQRFASAPADTWAERLARAGVPAVLDRDTVAWTRLRVMQESGVLLPAADGGSAPAAQVDVQGILVSTLAARPVVDIEAGWSGERVFMPEAGVAAEADTDPAAPPLAGVRVVDLANVIAGPSAGRTLAELGAEVTHVSAVAPRMGPRMNLLLGLEVNQGKQSLALDLHRPRGREALHRLLPGCDVLLYNKLPTQAHRLGVAPVQVHAVNDATVVAAVTAYGGVLPGGWENRPAYDPVIQALTGIMQRFGGHETPAVHGIASCIDYFTGYAAAFGAVVGLLARSRGDRSLVVRTSLVRTAGWVQLPQLCNPDRAGATGLHALGEGPFDRLYKSRAGWLHVGAGPRGGRPSAAPVKPKATEAWLRREIGARGLDAAVVWATAQGLVVQPVRSARSLRHGADVAAERGTALDPGQSSGQVVRVRHPAGEAYVAPDFGWLRFTEAGRVRPGHAPRPGEHSRDVLRRAGYTDAQVAHLLADGVAAEGWPGLSSYLPA